MIPAHRRGRQAVSSPRAVEVGGAPARAARRASAAASAVDPATVHRTSSLVDAARAGRLRFEVPHVLVEHFADLAPGGGGLDLTDRRLPGELQLAAQLGVGADRAAPEGCLPLLAVDAPPPQSPHAPVTRPCRDAPAALRPLARHLDASFVAAYAGAVGQRHHGEGQ